MILLLEGAAILAAPNHRRHHNVRDEHLQAYIDEAVFPETRMEPERYTPDEPRFRSYCCVVDFDREMSEHIGEILEPFRESGFDIVKLSGSVDGVKSEELYLISWDKRA